MRGQREAGLHREGLRGREFFAGHFGLRDGAFLDRPDRLAGLGVEHEDEALLGELRDDLARFLPLTMMSWMIGAVGLS